MIWIAVEGVIGAGKSTFIPILAAELERRYKRPVFSILEPVEEWTKSGVLEKMYKEPKIFNYPAQTYFFHSRITKLMEVMNNAPHDAIIISERSPYSDRIFWETQLENGRVTKQLHDMYIALWTMWLKLLNGKDVDVIIYIKPSLTTCMARVKKRARSEEQELSMSYQKTLQRLHDEKFLMDSRTCSIDNESDYRNDKTQLNHIMKIVYNKIG